MTATTAHDVFSATVHKSEEWIHELQRDLDCDPQQAYAALRGTLHALRDRLPADQAVQLAAQLPMLIRGLFYEGWKPAATPTRIHRQSELCEQVCVRAGRVFDMPVEQVIEAVFKLLNRHVSAGEICGVISNLPQELQRCWPD
ncbi:MAG: DUF2267 domain-containing protein [Phycisphaerales bacterium]|nr:DUF2267 domain-containing protein [Phycisphaerales bacterium]